jgi:eukaryotic-like serine/threonine-protein kinase
MYRGTRLSPDRKQLALEVLDPQTTTVNIWLFEFATGRSTRFTFGQGLDAAPLWSADGKRILYYSQRQGGAEWYQKAANGAGEEELVVKPGGGSPQSWSPDGRFVLYNQTAAPADVWAVDITANTPEDRKPIRLVSSMFNDVLARFSPDGKWFSYYSNESGANELYVQPFNPSSPEAGGKWLVSKGGALNGATVWRADGRELYYLRPDRMLMSVEVSTKPVFTAQVPQELFKVPDGVNWFDVSQEGQRFLLTIPSGAGLSTPPYKVVLNWTSTLKQ